MLKMLSVSRLQTRPSQPITHQDRQIINHNKAGNIDNAPKNQAFAPVPRTVFFGAESKTSMRPLSEVPVLNMSTSADEVAARIHAAQEAGKTVVAVFDHDGYIAPFVRNPEEAAPHGGPELYEEMIDKLESAGIKPVVLTARLAEQLAAPGVYGELAERLNISALNGNQLRLTLPAGGPETTVLVRNFENQPDGYCVKTKELPGGKLRISVDPIIPPEMEKIGEKVEKFEQLGLRSEDVGLISILHFRPLQEDAIAYGKALERENTNKAQQIELAHTYKVDKDIFNDIQAKLPEDDGSHKFITITQKNGSFGKIKLSADQLITYARKRFKEIVEQETTAEGNLVVEGHLDDSIKVNHWRVMKYNKGTALATLKKLFGGAFTIFGGDTIGMITGTEYLASDEYAIRQADIGIAQTFRNQEELGRFRENPDGEEICKRLGIHTAADYRFESYEDTSEFFIKVAENLMSKQNKLNSKRM